MNSPTTRALDRCGRAAEETRCPGYKGMRANANQVTSQLATYYLDDLRVECSLGVGETKGRIWEGMTDRGLGLALHCDFTMMSS
jgi:hypothetical protein